MKPHLSLCALVLFASLVGCASEPTTPTIASSAAASSPSAGSASDVICAKEYPTGSNIAVTKCRTPEQMASQKAAAQGLARGQAGGPNAKMGGN